MSDDVRWLSLVDAAAVVGVGKDWVYERVNAGLIPAVNITPDSSRPKRRIKSTDLYAYMDSLPHTG